MTNDYPEHINFSSFHDVYLKYILSIRNLPTLLPSNISFFTFFLIIFIIMIITSILGFIKETREDQTAIVKIQVTKARHRLDDEIINCLKSALSELHLASDKCYAKENFKKCIELIIYCPHLINVGLPNSNGVTPFHRVCYRGHFRLINLMISKGANVLQTSDFGENAFHMLINYYIRNPKQKNFKCLDLLFESACFSKKDCNFFKQFILEARESENKNLEEWLASHLICVSSVN